MTTVERTALRRGNRFAPKLQLLFPGLGKFEIGHLSKLVHTGQLTFPQIEITLPVGYTQEEIRKLKEVDRPSATAVNQRRSETFKEWIHRGLPSNWGEDEVRRLLSALNPKVTFVHLVPTPKDAIGALIVET